MHFFNFMEYSGTHSMCKHFYTQSSPKLQLSCYHVGGGETRKLGAESCKDIRVHKLRGYCLLTRIEVVLKVWSTRAPSAASSAAPDLDTLLKLISHLPGKLEIYRLHKDSPKLQLFMTLSKFIMAIVTRCLLGIA